MLSKLVLLQAIDLLIFKGKEELDVRGPCTESLADSPPCSGRGVARPACQGLCKPPTLNSTIPCAAQMVQQQHKQRHHLINDYVVGPQQARQVEELERKENLSKFMKGFYINDA